MNRTTMNQGWSLALLATLAVTRQVVADAGVERPDAGTAIPQRPADTEVDVPSPEGSYTAAVRLNGVGCANGSARVQISPDGKVFGFDFDALGGALAASNTLFTRHCFIAISVHSEEPLSYALTSLHYGGIATLDEGVQLSADANAYTSGIPQRPSDHHRLLRDGPFDGAFEGGGETAPEMLVYTACSKDRIFYVNLRVLIRALQQGGQGSAQLGAGPAPAAARLGISWRKCP